MPSSDVLAGTSQRALTSSRGAGTCGKDKRRTRRPGSRTGMFPGGDHRAAAGCLCPTLSECQALEETWNSSLG